MAIEVLEPEENFVHAYHHDLESLFYVLCWICSIQGGPANTRRVFDYMESEIRRWTTFDDSKTNMRTVRDSKKAIMPYKKEFEMKITKKFDGYFTPIIPCIENLRNLLFSGIQTDDEKILVKQRMLTSALNAIPRDEASIRFLMEELPVRARDPDVVCQSFVDIVEEGIKHLPEEHRRIPWVASVPPAGVKATLDIKMSRPLDVAGVADTWMDEPTKGKNQREKDGPSRAATLQRQQKSIAATGGSGRSRGSKRSFAVHAPEAQHVQPLRSSKRLRSAKEQKSSSKPGSMGPPQFSSSHISSVSSSTPRTPPDQHPNLSPRVFDGGSEVESLAGETEK